MVESVTPSHPGQPQELKHSCDAAQSSASCSLQSSPCLRHLQLPSTSSCWASPVFLSPGTSSLLPALTAKASGPLSTLGPPAGRVPDPRHRPRPSQQETLPSEHTMTKSLPAARPPLSLSGSPCPRTHTASFRSPDDDEAYSPNRWPQSPAVTLTHRVWVWSEFLDSSNPPASDSGVAEVIGTQLQTCLQVFPSCPVLGR